MDWVKKYYDAAKHPEWQKIHVGLDMAKPGGDMTVVCLRGRNAGKTALGKKIIREAKRKGYRVIQMESS